MAQLPVTSSISSQGAFITNDVSKIFKGHPLQYSLQSRFRGALLGLVLSPITLGLNSKTPTEVASENKLGLWRLSLELLRHHDAWVTRWQWIVSAVPSCLTKVEALIVGDVLELVLCDSFCRCSGQCSAFGHSDGFSGFTHLENRLLRYDLPIEQQRYYRRVFANISACLSPVALLSVDWSPQRNQDAVIKGVLCGLQHPASYGLSVQMAVQFGEIATLIAGLLAGALCSQSALPVLWQLKHSATADDSLADLAFKYIDVVAIADRLFNQWSGVLPNCPIDDTDSLQINPLTHL